eukprot:gnl/MRDRNA2_/MRDRNA2_115230_c0_seq1.p1 gnl/MRDRNA2_/MRDRNA2_115230_c0~~gnl/MRDRNA2_/MRDRNA2_115230_c0_seq1.p1  ORF type:complete len:223 (-),score=45.43 gnl/MRDRNA2_/MRDRNA2_115230_c0_seq1:80-748(-)
MSKYDRWSSGGSAHGGFAAGPSVPQSIRLDGLLLDFKKWFASIDGFGMYLQEFYTQYDGYFDDTVEEHSHMYKTLHKEFSSNLEASIDTWLNTNGLSESDFGDMLNLARSRGDHKSDEIVGVLLGMMEYQLWIESIFTLKRTFRANLLAQPQAMTKVTNGYQTKPNQLETPMHMMNVTVPEGVAAGQQVQVVAPDGQELVVVVPEGLTAGQEFSVSYVPLSQ